MRSLLNFIFPFGQTQLQELENWFFCKTEKQYMDQNILIRAKSPHNVCLLSKIGTIYLKNQNNLMDVPKYV